MYQETKKELSYSEEKLENLITNLEEGEADVYGIVSKNNIIGIVSQKTGTPIDYFLMTTESVDSKRESTCWTSNNEGQRPPNIYILVKDYKKIAISDDSGKVYSFGFKKSNDDIENLLVAFKTKKLCTIISANRKTNSVEVIDFIASEEKKSLCYCLESILGIASNESAGEESECRN
ncbi:MAG: hypothetical protein IKD04_04650 [Clostridia bacterium]|nr:hypothetical protein [Clostridia bacterium]